MILVYPLPRKLVAVKLLGGNTSLPMVPLANADPESSAYEKKKRAKTSKFYIDFESVVVRGIKKSQCNWWKMLFSITKSSSMSTIGRHLSKYVK